MAPTMKRTDEPGYYRRDLRSSLPPVAAQPQTPGPGGPVPDGIVWGEANVATLGPLRVLSTRDVTDVTIPCSATPLGVPNQAVPLVRNDFQNPMYVRIRLARNGAEGRVIISRVNAVKGTGGAMPGEWVDLATQPGRFFDAILLNSESLFGIGSWPGIVPLFINVTIAKWTP